MTTHHRSPPQGGAEAPDGVRRHVPSIVRAAALIGVSAAAALILAACGGDDDSPPQAATQVPASAAASDLTLETYALGLAQTDTGEPLGLDNITTLPSSETEEPIVLP